MEDLAPNEAFAKERRKFALSCIESAHGKRGNRERAIYFVSKAKAFSESYICEIQSIMGYLALDFHGRTEEDPIKVRKKLEEYDKEYNRDSGESTEKLVDCIRITANFETVDHLRLAYEHLTMSVHERCITNIRPEFDTKALKVTMNMGLLNENNDQTYLPIVGEV